MRIVARLLAPLCALFLMCGPAWAQNFGGLRTAAEITQALERVYGQAEVLQAEFVQVSRSAALGDEQQQRGRVAIKRPGRMRWEFTSPDRKLFVTDGQTMWIWSRADNQVIVYKGVAGDSSEVTALLSDLTRIDELFLVTLLPAEASATSYVLDLKPRNAVEGSFKSLQLTLSRQRLLLEGVLLTDQFDNITDLTFSQVRLDARVPDAEFVFQIPAGAEVVTPDTP